MTKITFYHSFLWPRCHLAGRVLAKLAKELELSVTKVDVTLHPRQAAKAGITMIPTLVKDDKKLRGIWLSKAKISAFVQDG